MTLLIFYNSFIRFMRKEHTCGTRDCGEDTVLDKRDIIRFIDEISLPAIALDKSGNKIYANNPMVEYSSGLDNGRKSSCNAMEIIKSASCERCPKVNIHQSGCLIPKETPYTSLLLAVRIPHLDNIMTLIYHNGASAKIELSETTLQHLLSGASFREGSAGLVKNQPGFVRISLKDIVDAAIAPLIGKKPDIENKIKPDKILESASPFILHRIFTHIFTEITRCGVACPITVNHMKSRDGASHTVVFQINSEKQFGKGMESEFNVLELRLLNLLRHIAIGTGLNFENPKVIKNETEFVIHFTIPSLMEPGEMKESKIFEKLSSREREILEMICSGYQDRDIAAELGITPATVKQHLKSIYSKTGINRRYNLVNSYQLGR